MTKNGNHKNGAPVEMAFAASQHVEAAKPILLAALFVVCVLAAMAIGGGVVAIIWNTQSSTEFDILGATLTTGHVGVAFTALGLIVMLFVALKVIKQLHKLAKLPKDQ